MPLPPAPSKRAALLSPDAHDAPARSSHKGSRRSADRRSEGHSAPGPQALELFDDRTGADAGGAVDTPPAPQQLKAPAAPQPARSYHDQPQQPSAQSAAAPQNPPRAKRKSSGPANLFVLDTNVLLHDPMCLFRFE